MERLITNVVAPIDFSEPSKRTARYAAGLARRLGASLHLVHVLDEERLYQETRMQLAALGATLQMPKRRLSVEVRTGPVAESITQAAIDYGADLVVMATHGRTGLSHLLMGSVAERVIRTARCPVLVVRACGQVHVHNAGTESMKVA
ncbi:MAG TPA: universal stress protein [Vicinamibacterales bacterium]|jgi:nucleotide-binding universal stress UspA family protein